MTRRSGSRRYGWLGILALLGLAFSAIFTPYSMLRDGTGIFHDRLDTGGYPSASSVEVVKTRKSGGAGRSEKAYDVRIRVNSNCLLHLQMSQPAILVGGGFSLIQVNGEPVQLDDSPTYDEVLARAQAKGFEACKK